MTRQHFEKLAKALHQAKPLAHTHSSPAQLKLREVQWKRDIHAISEVCHDFNPLFDADRFKQAAQEGLG